MLYFNGVITIVAMWLIIRSNWMHDLFAGSHPYNWLIGAIGTAALIGSLLHLLL